MCIKRTPGQNEGHRTIFSRPPIWAVGVPLSGFLDGDTFQPIPSTKRLTPKTNKYREQVEDLQDYPFLPCVEAPGSFRINLANLNIATYGGILTKVRNPVVTRNLFLKDQTVLKLFNIHWKTYNILWSMCLSNLHIQWYQSHIHPMTLSNLINWCYNHV